MILFAIVITLFLLIFICYIQTVLCFYFDHIDYIKQDLKYNDDKEEWEYRDGIYLLGERKFATNRLNIFNSTGKKKFILSLKEPLIEVGVIIKDIWKFVCTKIFCRNMLKLIFLDIVPFLLFVILSIALVVEITLYVKN